MSTINVRNPDWGGGGFFALLLVASLPVPIVSFWGLAVMVQIEFRECRKYLFRKIYL